MWRPPSVRGRFVVLCSSFPRRLVDSRLMRTRSLRSGTTIRCHCASRTRARRHRAPSTVATGKATCWRRFVGKRPAQASRSRGRQLHMRPRAARYPMTTASLASHFPLADCSALHRRALLLLGHVRRAAIRIATLALMDSRAVPRARRSICLPPHSHKRSHRRCRVANERSIHCCNLHMEKAPQPIWRMVTSMPSSRCS